MHESRRGGLQMFNLCELCALDAASKEKRGRVVCSVPFSVQCVQCTMYSLKRGRGGWCTRCTYYILHNIAVSQEEGEVDEGV